MIRNVVLGQLQEGVPLTEIEPALKAVVGLHPQGLVDCKVGVDLRLRKQSWDFAITSDFVDEASYRAYDEDAEHNRIRREMFDPLCAQLVRVQIEA